MVSYVHVSDNCITGQPTTVHINTNVYLRRYWKNIASDVKLCIVVHGRTKIFAVPVISTFQMHFNSTLLDASYERIQHDCDANHATVCKF